jgi:hypothetical protein
MRRGFHGELAYALQSQADCDRTGLQDDLASVLPRTIAFGIGQFLCLRIN